MKQELIMVRYGELSTKGKNRQDFIKKLGDNIKRTLKKFSKLTYEVNRDHIYIHLNEEPYEEIKPLLKGVSGASSFSLVYKVENDIVTLLGKSNCTDFVDCLEYRYKEMVENFALMVRGKENAYSYDYELGLYELVLKACGGKI